MDKNRIQITWYGTASVRICAGSSELLIDPFFPFPDSHVKVPADAFEGCSHILISHGHYDHIGSISRIVRPGCKVYCTRAPYRTLLRKGVSRSELRLIRAGSVLHIGQFRINAIKGAHIRLGAPEILKKLFSRRVWKYRRGIVRKLLRFASCLEKKETLCYLIEAYGKRILVLGSLALAPDTDYPRDADIVFFPYQGTDDMSGPVTEIYRRLSPKAVLLTHYDDTFPPFSTETDTTETEKYLRERTAVHKLRHGDSLFI